MVLVWVGSTDIHVHPHSIPILPTVLYLIHTTQVCTWQIVGITLISVGMYHASKNSGFHVKSRDAACGACAFQKLGTCRKEPRLLSATAAATRPGPREREKVSDITLTP